MTDERTCGSCYACCVHLGIKAPNLVKFRGISCRFLDGKNGPERRCSIYETRPTACQIYYCGYMAGLPNVERPDCNGLLISFYPSEANPGEPSATVWIIDKTKAGTLKTGPLMEIIDLLIRMGLNDIRVAHHDKEEVAWFHDGNVYSGKLLDPRNDPELLAFEGYDPPIGHYKVFEGQDALNEFFKTTDQNKWTIVSSKGNDA